MSGNPTSSAVRRTASGSAVDRSLPGTIGTPADRASLRALVLSPSESRSSGVGPTKVSPAAAQARANPLFSDRNP